MDKTLRIGKNTYNLKPIGDIPKFRMFQEKPYDDFDHSPPLPLPPQPKGGLKGISQYEYKSIKLADQFYSFELVEYPLK